MPPSVPQHLRALRWYRPQLAYVASLGLTPLHDPGDAAPVRADLRGLCSIDADFTYADLRGADLSGARLTGAYFTRAVLVGANLYRATFGRTNFLGADLRGANFCDAYLPHACMRDCDLTDADFTDAGLRYVNFDGARFNGVCICGADLHGAGLGGALGIRSAGPVGAERRMIYGVAYPGGGAMIQAGCHWGSLESAVAAVERRYAKGTKLEQFRDDYLAALQWVGGVR